MAPSPARGPRQENPASASLLVDRADGQRGVRAARRLDRPVPDRCCRRRSRTACRTARSARSPPASSGSTPGSPAPPRLMLTTSAPRSAGPLHAGEDRRLGAPDAAQTLPSSSVAPGATPLYLPPDGGAGAGDRRRDVGAVPVVVGRRRGSSVKFAPATTRPAGPGGSASIPVSSTATFTPLRCTRPARPLARRSAARSGPAPASAYRQARSCGSLAAASARTAHRRCPPRWSPTRTRPLTAWPPGPRSCGAGATRGRPARRWRSAATARRPPVRHPGTPERSGRSGRRPSAKPAAVSAVTSNRRASIVSLASIRIASLGTHRDPAVVTAHQEADALPPRAGWTRTDVPSRPTITRSPVMRVTVVLVGAASGGADTGWSALDGRTAVASRTMGRATAGAPSAQCLLREGFSSWRSASAAAAGPTSAEREALGPDRDRHLCRSVEVTGRRGHLRFRHVL